MSDIKKYDLAQCALSQVGKWCYVWGGNGQDMTAMTAEDREKWICRREGSDENRQRVRKLFAQLVENGVSTIRGGDCSGFVFRCMQTLGVWKSDMTANGMYRKTERVSVEYLQPGDLAFSVRNGKATHVGVYVGDGNFVHCKGRDVGVVLEKSKANYWQAYGVIKEFKEEPTPTPEPGALYVRFSGSVNVREQPKKTAKSLRVCHKGDKLPYLAETSDAADNIWYAVELPGGAVGYCSAFTDRKKKYTEVVEI